MTHNSPYCTNPDADLSFSNTNHLEWNQKKQDMILNLGLSTTQSESDQTPTPTRFIRNCEEVGLFQDLQNVNPFDEEFQKAMENPRGNNLQVPANTSDTLHTPQIYPELDECPKYPSNPNSSPDVYSLNLDQGDDDDNPLTIVLEPETENETLNEQHSTTSNGNIKANTREKIKATISQKSSGGITPVPIHKLLDNKNDPLKNGSQDKVNMADLLKQREANKASQIRCRKRKQKEFEDMKVENKILKSQNVRLSAINSELQQTITKLQQELRDAKSSQNQPEIDDTISTTLLAPPNNSDQIILPCTSHVTAPTSKRVNSTIGNSATQLPPVAPKLLLPLPVPNVNNPIGISLPNMANGPNTVVFVYPAPSKSVL